ncbi:hypothetical protein GBZ26_11035 [Azospirillum formosense]|uniref:HlyD family secretion protein n=1 Tax=Azospirillum formosense TaxID=861533 RepID=A0ABX2KZT9_9PROT|nr:hypothetical protein [Azospirillum formosense]MBY3753857.1 hypothetical protein [Azospirillum formosense]NUB19745.1 hypothetical protein [Azospirillum formosense]
MVRPAAWGIAVTLMAGLAPVLPARASDLPLDHIRAEVSRLVPPLWTVEEVSAEPIPAPAPDGKPAAKSTDSRTALRIGAKLRLAHPTYMVDSRDGAVTFIRPVAEAGLEKTLTATALATRGPNGWSARIELRNPEVLEGIGQPLEELPGRPVLVDSAEANRLRDQIAHDAEARGAEEDARRRREEDLLARQAAAAKAEEERAAAERRREETRAARIADLRTRIQGADRPARIAAYEAALGGNDPSLRQIALEGALQSRDAVLGNLALKDWIARRKAVPVQLYATKEDPHSEAVLTNLGPLTLEIDSFNPVNGALAGRLGAPGYSIAKPSAAVGTLAQTTLTVNAYGCALSLRLTEQQTLDGLFRCQTLPALIARVVVD